MEIDLSIETIVKAAGSLCKSNPNSAGKVNYKTLSITHVNIFLFSFLFCDNAEEHSEGNRILPYGHWNPVLNTVSSSIFDSFSRHYTYSFTFSCIAIFLYSHKESLSFLGYRPLN